MKRLLIIWHSLTGGTEAMVQAAIAGAGDQVHLTVKRAADAGPDDLLSTDGYLFACPENLASMAGMMKDFFDRCYYPLLGQVAGRPYAAMICAGSDGTGAARQIARIATGWRLKAIAEPLIICSHAQTPEDIAAAKVLDAPALAKCHDLAAGFATGLAIGVF